MSIALASRTATGNRWATRRLPCNCRPRSWRDRPIPTRAMPEVVARVGVDFDPVDVTDADDARWLRACLWPDQAERAARLEAEMALAATAPPLLLRGDAVEVMPGAFAQVPADALPVVTTTWALSHFPLESRLRFLHRLDEAAAGRAVAWVSAEGWSRAGDTDTWRSPRLWRHHHRPGGVRPVGPARRGHWPLLVAGPLSGVAGGLLVGSRGGHCSLRPPPGTDLPLSAGLGPLPCYHMISQNVLHICFE